MRKEVKEGSNAVFVRTVITVITERVLLISPTETSRFPGHVYLKASPLF